MEAKEIFETIYRHQLSGIMFHNNLKEYFAFLSLDKLSKIQEKRFIDETKDMLKLQRYYLQTYDKLLQVDESKLEKEKLVPQSWYQYNRFDVNTNDRQKSTKDGLLKWIDWETKTKTLYENMYGELIKNNDVASANYVRQHVTDVSKELKDAKKLYLTIAATNFDMPTIAVLPKEI